MTSALDPRAVRLGRVRGRYFRENFAQGGIDLAQVIPELVTNADAAIAASGRVHGRIVLVFAEPDPDFLRTWKRELRGLRVPALTDWRHELRCTDDGEGVDAEVVDARLGSLGVTPEGAGQRGLFGRGLRDVWLAQGGGRIEGVRAERAVESWFFPAAGDEPYAYVHVRDEPATPAMRQSLGLEAGGTRVTVPLALRRLPTNGRLRTLVTQLVQLRPILEDEHREVWLGLPDEPLQLAGYPAPDPDPERPLLHDDDVAVAPGVSARIVVRRAARPLSSGSSRATRRGGLVVRSGRAAHESTLAGHEGAPGSRHLYGEVWCEAIERLQREALDAPRPQVVVKVDRSGLNENHPVVVRLYAAIDRALRPIVAEEERRARAHLVAPGKAVRARDEVGLRALNDVLKTAFDLPGASGFAPGAATADRPPEHGGNGASPLSPAREPAVPPAGAPAAPIRFKRSPVRLHPGEQRTVSLLFDPLLLPPGTPVEAVSDPGLHLRLRGAEVPEPSRGGWSRLSGSLRARVSVSPGQRLRVLAEAGEHAAELEVIVVRHTASGWVREIARKEEDAEIEAHFDPESGVVTVYEGRREFKALERAARRAGLAKSRLREYLPYRMLEVEVAANAVYAWAAGRIVENRLVEEHVEPAEHVRALQHEAQLLRYRFHERLMRAFLDPEVFEGGVRVEPLPELVEAQRSLLE